MDELISLCRDWSSILPWEEIVNAGNARAEALEALRSAKQCGLGPDIIRLFENEESDAHRRLVAVCDRRDCFLRLIVNVVPELTAEIPDGQYSALERSKHVNALLGRLLERKERVESQWVDLDQIAGFVRRSKPTFESLKKRKKNPFPFPEIEGGGGKKDEWLWHKIRPWLEIEFDRQFPEFFPRLR